MAPVLETLVGRALEAAQFEAEDELRLAAIRQRRRHVEEVQIDGYCWWCGPQEAHGKARH
jgi:hypothetical protein